MKTDKLKTYLALTKKLLPLIREALRIIKDAPTTKVTGLSSLSYFTAWGIGDKDLAALIALIVAFLVSVFDARAAKELKALRIKTFEESEQGGA